MNLSKDAPDLGGRVAFVTGAGQGIGRSFANALAGAGARVVIGELNAESGAAVAEEICSTGGQAIALAMDVGDPQSVTDAFQSAKRLAGDVTILVNNAAIFSTLKMKPFDQIGLAEWERVLRVNVTGTWLCCIAAAEQMRSQGWGRIINIGSGAATLGRPNYLHYIASKGAVEAMTRSLARELGSAGITVNAILPGATFTEVERDSVSPEQREQIIAAQCIHRPQVPTDLIGPLLFLASSGSAFVTGQSVTVDGGATHR